MTQYSYKIIFSDSEMIMLRAALRNMILHCDEQLENGETAPYWAHRDSAKRVLNRLYDDVYQISGNNLNPFINLGEEE
jgi:hypothetical protein